jgi:hypothetical protein
VVLSYARPGLVGAALASVTAQTTRDRQVLVVDNHSAASEEIARIVAGFPDARLLAAPRNLGFTGGMNLGLRHATGRYVLFTEDDIVLPPDALAVFISHMESQPECGMVTGLVVEGSTRTILYAGGDAVLGPVWNMRVTGRGESDRGQYAEAAGVGYAPGCTILAPRSLLERLGGFREDFFLYYEDVDLSLRVLAAGFGIACLPRVRIVHTASPGTGNADLVEYHKIKNLVALYLLHAPARVLPEFFVRYGILVPLRELTTNFPRFRITVRSWLWVMTHLPALLVGRRAVAALRRSA